MVDPNENDSQEDSRVQMTERWEQDESELEAEDWEYHFGGADHDFEDYNIYDSGES